MIYSSLMQNAGSNLSLLLLNRLGIFTILTVFSQSRIDQLESLRQTSAEK
jgi:hypothetical protein